MQKPSKKQRIEDVTNEKECSSVVNSLNSLWVCRNAMNPKHNCVFCMCNQCYQKIINNSRKGQRTTRGRRNQMKSVDDRHNTKNWRADHGECNATNHHSHNLNQFGDSLYFTTAYKEKIRCNNADDRKSKKYVPFLCSTCKNHLVDK